MKKKSEGMKTNNLRATVGKLQRQKRIDYTERACGKNEDKISTKEAVTQQR